MTSVSNPTLSKNFLLLFMVCLTFFFQREALFAYSDDVSFVNSSDIINPILIEGAITRGGHPGFYEDYLVLHCLIKQYKPENLFEIGTCIGEGTMIIKNAIGDGTVYSLDLPPGVDKEYYFLDEHTTGAMCTLPYVQLFGDSMTFNYSEYYPIDSWFIDGHHDYTHAVHESKEALRSNPSICRDIVKCCVLTS